jgi:hypothetical protein
MAKKTKKQNWGVQNSQLPWNNQKINDMRGEKKGVKSLEQACLWKKQQQKEVGSLDFPAPSK